MKTVVLLNPPGKKLYIRDYYCSKISQADYINHPIDLLFFSGYLNEEYNIEVIDSIVSGVSSQKTLKMIADINPHAVVSLFGSVSWEEDSKFLELIKKKYNLVIIGSGDIFRENTIERLKLSNYIDGVSLDFTNSDVLSYLKGDIDSIENMVFRKNGEIISKNQGSQKREFEIPIPRHELFKKYKYRYPFIKSKKFATVLTDFGCPFKCTFCIMGTLGYKVRKIENVLAELDYIKSLGINEIFFSNQTFGADYLHSTELCSEMIKKNYDFGWLSFSRVDVLDSALLELMKHSGCHTLILGIESGDDEILKKYRKGYTRQQIVDTVKLCSKLGISVVGTFIFGLPEDSADSLNKTIEFLKTLDLDYASFNVAVPRFGTELRKEALNNRLVTDDFEVMDQSGTKIAMATKHLSRKDVLGFRRKAVRSFYFRPKYLLKRVSRVRNFSDFLVQYKQAMALLRQTWMRG